MSNMIKGADKQYEKYKSLTQKKGITLTTLVIMIIIMIILSSVAIFSVISVTNNGKVVAFSTDLRNIEQEVESYYLENKELPKITTTLPAVPTEYTKSTLSALSGSNGAKLESEIDTNGDTADTFFEIDLSKIKITSSSRGLKQNGDNDIYVANSRNLRVYYVKGYKIGADTYFSLTEKLTKSSNIQSTISSADNMSVTVETGGIKIIKSKSGYTNNLDVSVSSVLEDGQTLRYSVAGTTAIPITGSNYELKLNITTMTAITDAVANFTNATTPIKNFVVEKLTSDGTTVIAKATMNIANLDIQVPTIADTPTPVLAAFSDFNTITLSNTSDLGGAGIKEIRYEYYRKINSSSVEEDYLNPTTTIDEKYLLAKGKKTTGNILKLEKHIASVKIMCIDNAGNISDIKTYVVPTGNIIKEDQSVFMATVLTYRDRVLVDGGQVIDLWRYNDSIKELKDNDLYDSLVLNISTYGGIKKNIVNSVPYVAKVYEFNGGDVAQSNASYQPQLTNQGMQFDGTDDVLNGGSLSSYNFGTGSFTISIWFKEIASTSPYPVFLYAGGSGSDKGFYLRTYVSSKRFHFILNDGTNKYDKVMGYYTPGVWAYFSVVVDRENKRIYPYVNGILQAENTVDISIFGDITPNSNVLVGSGFGYLLNGELNDIQIFNRVFTVDEILTIYNFTKGRYIV